MKKFKITIKQSGCRLDKFLSDSLEDISRSKIQKLIKQGNIMVNKEIASAHYSLKEDDLVEIITLDENINKGIDSNNIDNEFNFHFSDIDIIAENNDYLVVNKPAGLIVHGADHIKETTLVDLLLEKYPKIRKIGEDPIRPGIVHRLDKEVSGLMVIPMTQNFFDFLKAQFKKRKVKKEYIALVYGQIDKFEDEIFFPIKRSSSGHKMAAVPVNSEHAADGAKRAITEFKIIKRFINYTLLNVKIKTGRTHQIRVHMLAYGHPIVCDNLYNTKRTREQNMRLRTTLKNIFLVASKLSFLDLKGKEQIFEINIPDKLNNFLKEIK